MLGKLGQALAREIDDCRSAAERGLGGLGGLGLLGCLDSVPLGGFGVHFAQLLPCRVGQQWLDSSHGEFAEHRGAFLGNQSIILTGLAAFTGHRHARVGTSHPRSSVPAVLGDTLVSVRDIPKSGLHIDMNTQQRSLLGSINPADCTVAEDARGSLLTMQVPGLAGRGKNPIEGTVVLGGLPFPAKLIMSDPPRVECYVSGLPAPSRSRQESGNRRPVRRDASW